MKHLLLLALIASCGGNDTKLVALDSGGEADLCSYILGHSGTKRMIDCGGGSTITVGGNDETQAQCVAGVDMEKTKTPAGCTATVGDVEDCLDAQSGESDAWFCSQISDTPQPVPSACAVLDSAACQPANTPRLWSLASPQLSVDADR